MPLFLRLRLNNAAPPRYNPATEVSRLRATRFILLVLCLASTAIAQPRIRFVALGDFGSNDAGQKAVAGALAQFAGENPIDAALMLGDNCYIRNPPPQGREALWEEMFERMYDAKALAFPFYAVAGNHDYKEKHVGFQLKYSARHPESRWKMPDRWYRLELPAGKPLVTLLMLDSDRTEMGPEDWAKQMAWIEAEVAKPRTTPWVIAAAHHTIFSNGDHGDSKTLQQEWGPLLKKAGVGFYVCGHDHDMQHLEMPDWAMSFIVAGGGGTHLRPIRRDRPSTFAVSRRGFAELVFTENVATCRMVDVKGTIMRTFERDRSGKVSILSSIASDKPVPKPPKPATKPSTLPAGVTGN